MRLRAAFCFAARRGAPGLAHGVRKRNVVVGPAILSLKGKPPLAASAGGALRPHGCGDCETSAANYGVAMDGH